MLDPDHIAGSIGLRLLLVAAVVASTGVAVTGTAAASSGLDCQVHPNRDAEVKQTDVIDLEDRDGDGYASSFRIEVTADTDFRETSTGIGKGEPVIAAWLDPHGANVKLAEKSVGRSEHGTYYLDVSDVPRTVSSPHYCVRLGDDNSGNPGIFGIDSAVDDALVIRRADLKVEPRAQDRTAQVRVTSNVDGAVVHLDGERVGTTPWTGKLPVDHAGRNGPTTVKLTKDGWESQSRRVRLDSPESVHLTMEKVREPLAVSSSPTGATVYVDGQKVGTTPLVRQYWVKSSHTVRVEETGYFDETYRGVSPKATVHADLTKIEDPRPNSPTVPGDTPEVPPTRIDLTELNVSAD